MAKGRVVEQVRNAKFSTADGFFITGEWLHPSLGWIPHTAVRGESEIMDAVFDAFLALPPAPYVDPVPDLDAMATEARDQRDAVMRETDWMVLPDSPLSADDHEKVLAYRQALRDVPIQAGFPVDIVWPVLDIEHAWR